MHSADQVLQRVHLYTFSTEIQCGMPYEPINTELITL